MSLPEVSATPDSQRSVAGKAPKSAHQRRVDRVFVVLGIFLLIVVIIGFTGLIQTVHPNALGHAPYQPDGGAYQQMTPISALWMWVTGMSVAGALGLGIAFAYQHQH